jgi:hypothetical protein
MVKIGRRRTFRHYGYFVISFLILMTLISPNKSLQFVQTAIAQSKSMHHLCIFGSVAICPDTTTVITPQISANTSATTKAPASVSAPPSLEELAGQNVTKTPANVTATPPPQITNVTKVPANVTATPPPQITNVTKVPANVTAAKAPANVTATPPPQITNVTKAPANVTAAKAPANVTAAKAPANVTAPSTNASEHNKNEPVPQL